MEVTGFEGGDDTGVNESKSCDAKQTLSTDHPYV